jgi:hypothetical protein
MQGSMGEADTGGVKRDAVVLGRGEKAVQIDVSHQVSIMPANTRCSSYLLARTGTSAYGGHKQTEYKVALGSLPLLLLLLRSLLLLLPLRRCHRGPVGPSHLPSSCRRRRAIRPL